jgi:membrane protein
VTLPPAILFVWNMLQGMTKRFGFEIAGYIAFSVMLALFPFMIFLVSLAGFFGNTQSGEDFLSAVSLFAPPDVMDTIRPAISQVIQHRSGSLLTIGLVLALYSASSAVAALRMALNLAYGVDEARPFWMSKGLDFAIVLVGSLIVILSSLLVIAGPWIWSVLASFRLVDGNDRTVWHLLRYGFALALMLSGVTALHRLLPDIALTLRSILPGAVLTTVLWIVAASALTFYFDKFANYTATYGSLGGVIITLLFFYVSAIIFILGGEWNAALLARSSKKTAAEPNPEVEKLTAQA